MVHSDDGATTRSLPDASWPYPGHPSSPVPSRPVCPPWRPRRHLRCPVPAPACERNWPPHSPWMHQAAHQRCPAPDQRAPHRHDRHPCYTGIIAQTLFRGNASPISRRQSGAPAREQERVHLPTSMPGCRSVVRECQAHTRAPRPCRPRPPTGTGSRYSREASLVACMPLRMPSTSVMLPGYQPCQLPQGLHLLPDAPATSNLLIRGKVLARRQAPKHDAVIRHSNPASVADTSLATSRSSRLRVSFRWRFQQVPSVWPRIDDQSWPAIHA